MRSEGQVRQQLKQVAFRHLQKRLRDNFRQRPDTCLHNGAVLLDEAAGTTVGLCGVLAADGSPRHVPCDARIAGCLEMARGCPLWEPIQSKDAIKAEFTAVLQSADRGLIASQYPDIAALLWVLDNPAAIPTVEELAEAADKIEEAPAPPHRFWGAMLKKWGGVG